MIRVQGGAVVWGGGGDASYTCSRGILCTHWPVKIDANLHTTLRSTSGILWISYKLCKIFAK